MSPAGRIWKATKVTIAASGVRLPCVIVFGWIAVFGSRGCLPVCIHPWHTCARVGTLDCITAPVRSGREFGFLRRILTLFVTSTLKLDTSCHFLSLFVTSMIVPSAIDRAWIRVQGKSRSTSRAQVLVDERDKRRAQSTGTGF